MKANVPNLMATNFMTKELVEVRTNFAGRTSDYIKKKTLAILILALLSCLIAIHH